MSPKRLKILCVHCQCHLYWYKGSFAAGQQINMKDFSPATSGIPHPGSGEAMMCFRCGQPFYFTSVKGSMYLLTNDGIKPRPPLGVPKVFTPDPFGSVVPELPPEFRDGEATEYKEPNR